MPNHPINDVGCRPYSSRTYFRTYFGFVALLNFLFLGLQLLYLLILTNNSFDTIPLPKSVYLEVIGEAFLQIVLYLLLIALQLTWGWGINKRYSDSSSRNYLALLFIYLITLIFILSTNAVFFPLSRFSQIILFVPPNSTLPIFAILSAIVLGGLTLNTFTCLPLKKLSWGLVLCGLALVIFFNNAPPTRIQFPEQQNPNIILIGVDSLSPEHVNPKDTPTLAHFLQDSVHFTETISPLARTYSAWTSILTGLYPLHHHARENLLPKKLVKSEASIVWKFRELGYSTLFASDDRRFNNLDKDFGFQRIVGPKLGINDFLLGTFYDFPLSNLLINNRISHWLFPYNYMSRASNYVYYPHTFDKAVKTALNETNPSKPLFLAVHFTLPHWPYSWAESPRTTVNDEFNLKAGRSLYYSAVKAVDHQVDLLINDLEQHNLLSNSIIFVLSDHGEALYEPGSRITLRKNYQSMGTRLSALERYFKEKTQMTLEQSGGHGSDLLSPTQYHCMLGVKIFKHNKTITTAKKVNTRVALIDIAPTIYALMHLPRPQERRHFDGISLLSTILGNTALIPRAFLLESGILPNQILSMKKAIFYMKLLYEVEPDSALLQIKQNKLQAVNAMKLYGIIENDWLLVLYPNANNYIPALVQLSSQQWTDDLYSRFAKRSPVNELLSKLRAFYQVDLGDYPLTRYTNKIGFLTFKHDFEPGGHVASSFAHPTLRSNVG